MSDASDLPSPWSSDEIEAGPAPEFEWDTPPEKPADERSSSSGSGRRNQVLIAVACAAVLLIAALALWPGGDDPLDEADDGDETATTLDSLPDVDTTADTEPDEDRADAEPDVEDSSDEILGATPDTVENEVTIVDLPPAVAAITEPTEIVMVQGGQIITMSLPSGTLRRTPLGAASTNGSGFVVADDAVAWFGNSELSIAPRQGPPLSVEVGENTQGGFVADWVIDDSGSTVFLVETYGASDGAQYTVSVDGVVEPYEPVAGRFDTFDFFGGLRPGAGGREIVNDAGGVYLIDGVGDAERISDGRALASNKDFVLLRECDETLSCGYAVLDIATRERQPSPVTTEQLGTNFGYDLSPDGASTLTVDFQNQQRRLVDLVAGALIAEIALPPTSSNNTQWAADSSGVFQVDPGGSGLSFVDRSTGESIQFATELGRVSELGVRMPDTELDATADLVSSRPLTFSENLSGPIDIDLVVLGDLGSMGYLDLDAATASIWSVPAVPGSNEPDLLTNGATVTVLAAGSQPGFVTEFGRPRPIDAGEGVLLPGFPRFPGPAPGVVWSPTDGDTDGVDHRLMAVDGGQPESPAAIELAHSELLGDDGAGRLAARVGGAVFIVGVDGVEKLTDGEILALGPNHALIRSCDDDLACSVQRVRRSDGGVLDDSEPSPEVTVALGVIGQVGEPSRSPRLGGTMSPDGGAVLVRGAPAGNSRQWLVVDFTAGNRFVVPAPVAGQPIIWNEDSSSMAYLSANGVNVIERSTGTVSTIEGLGAVRAITAVGPEFAAADI